MTPTSAVVSWTAWSGTQPIFYITNYRVTGNTAWIPNPLGLTQSLSQPITGLTGGTTYDVRVQASNKAGVAFSAVYNFTTPAGHVVFRDAIAPVEWRGIKIVSRDVVVPLEVSQNSHVVSRNVTISPEWTGPRGIFSDFVVPVDIRTGVTFSRDVQVPIEWTGPIGVSRDFVVPVDISPTPLAPPLQVQNLALSSPTTTSLLATWDDLLTGPRPQGYTLEWKRTTDPITSFLPVVPSVPEPVTPFGVSRTFAVPIEYGGHATSARDVIVPLEFMSPNIVRRDFPVVMDFGGALTASRSFDMPIEFGGSTQNVSRDFIVQTERRGSPSRNNLVNIDFRATPLPQPPQAFYVEIDLGDGATFTDPATGIVWGLANQSGGVATQNSIPNAASAPTDILVRTFSPTVVWARDAAHPLLWRSWNGSAWVPPGGTSDPRFTNVVPGAVTSIAVANTTSTSITFTYDFPATGSVIGGGFKTRFQKTTDTVYSADTIIQVIGPNVGQITDASGRVFSINSAGRVVVNGVADASTSSATKFLIVGGRYWYESGG